MDTKELEKITTEILSGIKALNWNSKIYFIRQPYYKEKIAATEIYNIKVAESLKEGLISEEELLEKLNEVNIWTENDEVELEEIIERIKTNKNLRVRMILPSQKEKINEQINELTKKYYEKLYNKYHYYTISAEGYASSYKDYYLMTKCILNENHKNIWGNIEDVLNYDDSDFILHTRDVLNKFVNWSDFDAIRNIAKSSYFRGIWNISKKCGEILRPNVLDWSIGQTELIKMAFLYDSVYDDYERPTDDIIEDDDALDDWLRERRDKIQAKILEKTKYGKLPESGDVILIGAKKGDIEKLRAGDGRKRAVSKNKIDMGE
jgi:hypothetical protein